MFLYYVFSFNILYLHTLRKWVALSIFRRICFGLHLHLLGLYWELTKKHFIVMLGLVLGYMVLLWVISLLSGTDTTTFRYWILYLVNLVLSVWVNAGFAKILLNAYDGEEPSFSVFKELLPFVIVFQWCWALSFCLSEREQVRFLSI